MLKTKIEKGMAEFNYRRQVVKYGALLINDGLLVLLHTAHVVTWYAAYGWLLALLVLNSLVVAAYRDDRTIQSPRRFSRRFITAVLVLAFNACLLYLTAAGTATLQWSGLWSYAWRNWLNIAVISICGWYTLFARVPRPKKILA